MAGIGVIRQGCSGVLAYVSGGFISRFVVISALETRLIVEQREAGASGPLLQTACFLSLAAAMLSHHSVSHHLTR